MQVAQVLEVSTVGKPKMDPLIKTCRTLRNRQLDILPQTEHLDNSMTKTSFEFGSNSDCDSINYNYAIQVW